MLNEFNGDKAMTSGLRAGLSADSMGLKKHFLPNLPS